MNTLYSDALKKMNNFFDSLSLMVGMPSLIEIGEGYAFRFRKKTIYQAILLKLARVVSGLHTILLLNRNGFLQEQGAIQRTLDEFEEDVLFLSFAIIFDEFTANHKVYLDGFFEEEFDVPESAISSTQNRPMVSRKKIRAFISKARGAKSDPSSSIEVARTMSKTYSGYIHGAAPHILELFYGTPPKFHINGTTDSPFFTDHFEDILNYFYRSILAFSFAAKAFGNDDLCIEILDYSKVFAKESGEEGRLRDLNT